jgi:osmotically-inducible protein OsmY
MPASASPKCASTPVEGDREAGRIADRVASTLRAHSHHVLRAVTCEAEGSVVVLRGCLPTYYLKQLAQTLAARTDGVRQVDNQIVVATPCCESQVFS